MQQLIAKQADRFQVHPSMQTITAGLVTSPGPVHPPQKKTWSVLH